MTNKHRHRLSAWHCCSRPLSRGTAFAGAHARPHPRQRPPAPRLSTRGQAVHLAGAGGAVEGYGAALCERIAARVKSQLGLSQLAVDWVPVHARQRARAPWRAATPTCCARPSNATLERRKTLSFSMPVFAGGIRAVVRNDVAPQRCATCSKRNPAQRNVWRGSPALTLLEKTRFATVAGTSSEKWLAGKVASFKLNTATVSVPDYASGIKFLLERKIDVFLAERDVVLAAMDDKRAARSCVVLNRQLTHEPLALALPRGDEDFRLLVDTALSAAYNSPEFAVAVRQVLRHARRRHRATSSAWVTPAP